MRNPKPLATMQQNKKVGDGFHAFDSSDADMHAIAAFRKPIDAFSAAPENHSLTRSSALALMKLVIEFLSPLTDDKLFPLGGLDPSAFAVGEHPAVELLGALRDAISDLDRGKTHPALSPNPHGANRSLLTIERKEEERHRAAVLVLQRRHGYRTRAEAIRAYVKILQEKGKRIKGKKPTQAMMKRLFTHKKKPSHSSA
jgi:hypothetical protein